ncbi:Poly(beta-D-mannuronate) C5 epimerase 5 [bacterium HR40]|nr:Poly(beta-D-mannuronate) C5 epimerase 5 [bacterium HR40]
MSSREGRRHEDDGYEPRERRYRRSDGYGHGDEDHGWSGGFASRGGRTIYGSAADDLLVGTAGKDRIYGLAGHDRIEGGNGDDKLYGGTGIDEFVFAGQFGKDEIEDAESGENLTFRDLATTDLSFATDGDDLYIVANDGSGRVQIEKYFVYRPELSINGTPLAGLLARPVGSDIVGTDASERLRGTAGDDVIDAAGGNDRVDAEAGDDEVYGGAGNDKLEGGSGNDTIAGGAGNDKLEGESGDDTLRGDGGNDYVEGGSGVDTAVFSGSSEDFLVWGRSGRLQVWDTRAADGDEGRDFVKDVEVLQFDDTTIELTAVSPSALSSFFASGPITAAELDSLLTAAV